MISAAMIEETAFHLMAKAGIEIPDDYLSGIKRMAAREEGDLSAFVLQAMLENWEAAKADRLPGQSLIEEPAGAPPTAA